MGKAIFPGTPHADGGGSGVARGRGALRRGDVLKFGNVQD